MVAMAMMKLEVEEGRLLISVREVKLCCDEKIPRTEVEEINRV